MRGLGNSEAVFRLFEKLKYSNKGRTCREHAMTEFMSNVNIEPGPVSATPA